MTRSACFPPDSERLPRASVRKLASRVLVLEREPITREELENILRHSNLPFALDAYIREQHARLA